MCLVRILFGLGAFLMASRAHSQDPGKPLAPTAPTQLVTRQKVLDDLHFLQHIHERAHAGLYKYRTKAQMDSAFATARQQVTDSMSILDVYQLIATLTDFEGSLHNDTFLPDSVIKAMNRQVAFFLCR